MAGASFEGPLIRELQQVVAVGWGSIGLCPFCQVDRTNYNKERESGGQLRIKGQAPCRGSKRIQLEEREQTGDWEQRLGSEYNK